MTAMMDRRKSLGLAKSTNRPAPETSFKEEDENTDGIYGTRPRDVSNVEVR